MANLNQEDTTSKERKDVGAQIMLNFLNVCSNILLKSDEIQDHNNRILPWSTKTDHSKSL
jgi:hypothetical protein